MNRSALLAFFMTSTAWAADPPFSVERFEKEIRPLLLTHCTSCHDGKKKKGGLDLTTRIGLLRGGDGGPAIHPGDPGKSQLIDAVKYDGDLKMPPKGKLKAHEIASLESWVKGNAPWPESTASETKRSGSGITDEQRQFWSFRPIPEFDRQKSIDGFIDRKLMEARLKRSSPADKRTLLRRVTFDLIGLPPTPAELAAFEADAGDSAYDRVVDRLLASPHYGERWARHWLDVARYADTNGMDENTGFQNAWKYRDYVVRSWNADKPFDQFVREQIAGDLLAYTSDEQRRDHLTATGFLVIGPKLLAEPDKQKMVTDIVDEQLDTTAKAFLGLTVGCARCHDHKFDPIPTKDYYAIAGIFASTKTMQTLATVAKVGERPLTGEHELAKAEAHQKRVDAADKLAQKVRHANNGRIFIAFGGGAGQQAAAAKLNDNVQNLKRSAPPVPMALAVTDEAKPTDWKVHVRGNHLTLGEPAPRGGLQVVPHRMDPISGSGRLQFADWIASPANPLTARVIANRVWQHHFGEGLVRSPDNFGKLGDRPTHPELLDWLAGSLIHDGWSLKKLHKRIVTSQTYRQANGPNPDADPENRLLSHFPRRRLDAESIRDGMLAISGQLDRTIGGSLFVGGNFEYVREHNYDSPRRSLYLPLIRNNVFDFFQTFDFPEPNVTNGKRSTTTVAPQALYLLNNPFVAAQAKAFAERIIDKHRDVEDRIRSAIQTVYLRVATDADLRRAKLLIERYRSADPTGPPAERELRAWSAWVNVLLASNEFLHVD
jgi:cytochrome c553